MFGPTIEPDTQISEHRQMLRKFMNDFLNVDGTSATAGMMPGQVAANVT